MKAIESDAIDEMYRTLGLAGGVASEDTKLDDGIVVPTLPLTDIIRRSRTSAATTGWFYGIFENDHLAAGEVFSVIDPYNAGDDRTAPFPRIIPNDLDFWVLSASLRRVAGAGTLDGAVLSVNPAAVQMGWGVDDMAAPVAGVSDRIPLALWTGLDTSTTIAVGQSGNGALNVKIAHRIPRGIVNIEFRSDVAGAAATIRCYLICGLFAQGLGQDIAS